MTAWVTLIWASVGSFKLLRGVRYPYLTRIVNNFYFQTFHPFRFPAFCSKVIRAPKIFLILILI
jgi:hypothetical protein